MLLTSIIVHPQFHREVHIRLTLKVFHDIEKPVVYIGLVVELDLDLVEVGKSILLRTVSTGTLDG